jgi:hypothetical protein
MSQFLAIIVFVSIIISSDASPYSSQSKSNHQTNNNQIRYIPSSLLDKEEGDWISLHPDIEFLPSNYYGKKSPQDNERIAAATQQFLFYQSNSGNSHQHATHKSRNQRFNSQTNRHQKRGLEEGDGEAEEEEQQSASSSGREDNSQYRVQPFVEGVSDYDAYQQAWRMLGFMIDCNTISAYDQSQNNNNNDKHSNDNDGTGEGCTRYVLWAAVRRFTQWIYPCTRSRHNLIICFSLFPHFHL